MGNLLSSLLGEDNSRNRQSSYSSQAYTPRTSTSPSSTSSYGRSNPGQTTYNISRAPSLSHSTTYPSAQPRRVTPAQTVYPSYFGGSLDEVDDSFHNLNLGSGNGKLSIAELKTLMKRVDRIDRSKQFQQVIWVYRDKPEHFFTKAIRQHGGVMKMYKKDHSGDPRSPINGEIDGLFFATNQPPSPDSYFGNRRIRVQASFFFSKNAQTQNHRRVRLYFADFYCMSKMHWVTLVLTYEGTATDRFCESRLPELDLSDNDFLYVDNHGTVWKRTSPNFKTEIFYTADVDLYHWQRKGGVIEIVNGLGQSSTKGKRKQSHCTICNL